MKGKLVVLVVLLAIGIGAAGVASGAFGASAAPASQYLTATAATGDVIDEVAATGTLAAATTYGLVFGHGPYLIAETAEAPPSDTAWPVTSVSVKVGDRVTAGAPLAAADHVDLDRRLATATADLRSANIDLAIAEDRLDDVGEDDIDAERQALLGLYGAQNRVAAAADARNEIIRKRRIATLIAPVDGMVTEVNVVAGFDAPSGPAVIVASTTYEVTTDVVERDLGDIEVGQAAMVAVEALDVELEGVVTAISPVPGDGSSGVVAYPVTITITSAPEPARPGMSADVTITVASATGVLTVPASAIQGGDGDYAVLVLGHDGTPQLVPVEVGLVTSTGVEIRSGLAVGSTVVTGTASDLQGTVATNGGGFANGGVGIPGGGGPIIRRDGQFGD